MAKVVSDQIEPVLVDTDVYSYLLSGKNYAALYRPHVEGKLLCLSFITVGELHFGALNKYWGKKKIADLKDRLKSATIVPYDEEVCLTYAKLKKALQEKGKSVAINDLWIASCAVRHSIPLVTNNRKHFDLVPGLVVISESQAMTEMQSQSAFEGFKASASVPERPSEQSASASAGKAPPPAPRRP